MKRFPLDLIYKGAFMEMCMFLALALTKLLTGKWVDFRLGTSSFIGVRFACKAVDSLTECFPVGT